MITGFLLQMIYAFLTFLLGLLPSGGSIASVWVSGVYQIWGYVNSFSFIVPVNMLVFCLGIAMTFHLFVFAWKGLHWISSHIRGARIH